MTSGSSEASRPPGGRWAERALVLLGVTMALYHLVAGSALILIPGFLFRGLHLLLALFIGFLLYRKVRGAWGLLWDGVLLLASLLSLGYIIVNHSTILARVPWTQEASFLQILLAISCTWVVLALTWRCLGAAMPIVCLVFLAYAFFGSSFRHFDLTRRLAHTGVTIDKMVDQIYLSFEGIFGLALGISANYIFLFVLFGSFLQHLGGGKFFIEMAKSLAGGWRGGPAKIAVLASSVFGTISGSAAANVMTTGAFTIPMMKKLGYRPEFAGAVEAVASTGGQIMPPVMGASAFIMAEILGITYFEVAARAAVPALLYYATLLAAIHMEAIKEKLPSLPSSEVGSARRVFFQGWTFLVPLVGLVVLLALGFTPERAGFYAVLMTAGVPLARSVTRVEFGRYIDALVEGAKSSIPVVAACAAAGIIIGVVNITGLGFRFSSLILNLSGGQLFAALFLTMLASIILGMGLPTTPAYIVMATLVAPAIIEMGVKPIGAHMFCFYYAILAAITPPVAIASFAAAPLAQASANQIGWRSFRLALPVYFVPFLFVYDPGLLILEGWGRFFYVFAKAILACSAVAAVSTGYIYGRGLSILERALFMAFALILIHPSTWTDLIGTVGILGMGGVAYSLGRGHRGRS
jgi:TRAP transporter 4TM/12TM fusion protein